MAKNYVLDWNSNFFGDQSTQVLLNPQLTDLETTSLKLLAMKYQLPAHVWIASSGSSASSTQSTKLIALSKKAVLASAKSVNTHLQVTDKDIWAQVLPLFHVGGLGIEARSFLSGSKVVSALVKEISWDAKYFHQVLESKHVTLSSLVPTQVYDLVSLGLRSPNSLRAVIVGGAALSDDLYLKARELGWPLLPSFGMTEASSQIATASVDNLSENKRDLQVLPHLQVRLSDNGLIEVSGESILTGYAQRIKNLETFVDPKKEGWFETSDIGIVDGNTICPEGRSEDFVKILGEGVSLLKLDQTLESVLASMKIKNPDQYALVAAPDERSGAKIVLLLGDANTEAKTILDLIRSFDQKVNPYEKIKEHHFVEEIPRSSLGKLLRKKLLDQLIRS